MKTHYSSWFIVSASGFVLAYRQGRSCMVKATKRGIPQQAFSFDTEGEAQQEADFLMRQGFFPLYGQLKAKQLSWS